MAIYCKEIYCKSQAMCYNIYIMKKKLIILAAITLIITMTLVLAGCGEGFSKNSIRKQIDDNLGWHENGMEICTYDVVKDGVKVGEYTSGLELYNGSVTVETSNETVKPTLDSFVGYKFTSSMKASLEGKTFEKHTESYATMRMEPKLSYVMTVDGDLSVETVTTYYSKKSEVTFIKGEEVKTASSKYSKSAFVVDNSFLYQFSRVTSLSSALSIVVPTYDLQNCRTSNETFSCSYSKSANAVLEKKFVLNSEFSHTIPSGESGEITSGEPVNSGSADNSGDIQTSTDESGNVTVTYPHTVTSVIPVLNCTFATSKTFPSSGKISCLIANSPMKMQGDDNFANRVVVRFVEGDVVYNLTSVKFVKR